MTMPATKTAAMPAAAAIHRGSRRGVPIGTTVAASRAREMAAHIASRGGSGGVL
jgi:hypothetical protein